MHQKEVAHPVFGMAIRAAVGQSAWNVQILPSGVGTASFFPDPFDSLFHVIHNLIFPHKKNEGFRSKHHRRRPISGTVDVYKLSVVRDGVAAAKVKIGK